jgi:hypothetical protein
VSCDEPNSSDLSIPKAAPQICHQNTELLKIVDFFKADPPVPRELCGKDSRLCHIGKKEEPLAWQRSGSLRG